MANQPNYITFVHSNHRMIKRGITILLVLAALKSCYYLDSDVHMVDIKPEITPRAIISSNLDALDTIFVADSLLFKYLVDIDTGQLFLADVYLSNYLLYRSDTIQDSIWIYRDYIQFQGEYELKLVAYYQSLSGSLADIIGAEFMVSDTSWTLTFGK